MKTIILFVILILSVDAFSQTWPSGSDANDVSSAFGARLYGGYNFHEGMDISLSYNTDVTAIKDGVIKHFGSIGTVNENVKVLNDDGTTTVYMHVNRESTLVVGQDVYEGTTIVGAIRDDHLHVEYRGVWDKKSTSYHPLSDLPYTNASNTLSVTDNEIKSDTYGSFIEIEVSSLQSDLDVASVVIDAIGLDDTEVSWDEWEIFKAVVVDFEDKWNCIDYTLEGRSELDNDGRLIDDDNDCALQIVTQNFNGSNPQILKFKFYIDEDYLEDGWLELSSLTISINFYDAQNNLSTTEPVSVISSPVGVEDAIIFMPGIIFNGQLVEVIYEPNTHYFNYSGYTLNFNDVYPYGDYIVNWDNWKCYASYSCGEVLIMDSQSFNIPSLPNGYNWERDANNNVIARMEKSGTDNDGVYHSTSAQIKISSVPNYFVTSGTIPVNTTWCGGITITGDILVPAGKQLTILSNSRIIFSNNSSLIIEGNLVFETHDFMMSSLNFQSQNSTLKNGIKINPGGTASISNTIIKNAYNGVYVNEGVLDINDSEIFDCYYGIHLYRTNYVSYQNYITNTHSYNNEFGVVMYYSNAHLSNNEFNNNWIGVGCADYSSPYLAENDGSSQSIGQNNIHNNDIAVFAYGYSNPRLGRVNCTSDGGKNIIENNNNYDFFSHTYSTVYAEGNYWGGGTPIRYVGGGCSFDYTPYLASAPQMSQTSGNSPEEEVFDIQFNQQQSKANNSTDVLALTSSDKPKGFDEKWSIEWKLLYARNLINVKKYNSASAICEEVISNYPDSSLSYLALDLLHQSRVSSKSKSLFSQFVKEKANKKVKKQIYGVAELLLAGGEKKDRVAVLDEIAKRYKTTPLIEFVLFQKFMYYLYEENNLEMAKSTSEELEKLFPKSESYFDSQRHLGNDVKRTLEPQLKKSASNEESFEVPKTYELLGNYPNPFNPSTTIKYALPYSSNVELTIYDITGKVVKVFEETIQSAGYQNIVWHGNNQYGSRVSSGVYFYRFKATSLEGDGKSFEKTAKMLLLK